MNFHTIFFTIRPEEFGQESKIFGVRDSIFKTQNQYILRIKINDNIRTQFRFLQDIIFQKKIKIKRSNI